MRYFDWNNAIGNYFFNYEKAGKDVLFFISPSEIAKIGINQLGFTSEDESLKDFFDAIGSGYSGFTRADSIIKKIDTLFTLWEKQKNGVFKWKKRDLQVDGSFITDQRTGITYPLYLSILAILVMPLTTLDETYKATAYYPRLKKFLEDNNLCNDKIGTADFNGIDKLWDDLSDWSINIYKTDIGIFKVGHFGNKNWIHVGRIFSQCVLTPSDIKNLPKLFSLARLMPDTSITDISIKRGLIQYGKDVGLSKNALKILNDGDDDLQNVIIGIAKNEHKRWDGNIGREQGERISEKEAWILTRLFSAFTINRVTEQIHHCYFVFSRNDYPDALTYNEYQVKPLGNGYSYPLEMKFNSQLVLEDRYNKWRSSPVDEDIYLYRNGINGIPSDYWIQTDRLHPTQKMFLLCSNLKSESLKQWGQSSFENGKFKEADLDGIPDGYTLFSFTNPQRSHPEEPLLQLQTQFEIEFIGGLKVKNRSFLNYYLPKVRIEGIGNDANVYAEYIESKEQMFLNKSLTSFEEWEFPEKMTFNEEFIIKVEAVDGLETYPHQIVTNCIDVVRMDDGEHPKRNSYGDIITNDLSENDYVIGNNTYMPNWSQQGGDLYLFLHSQEFAYKTYQQSPIKYFHNKGNALLYYLTLHGKCNSQTFGLAFDNIFYSDKMLDSLQEDNLKRVKKYALLYLDYLGYLDYEQTTQQIAVNKPQIILIPTKEEVKAYLIGARTEEFIEQLFEVSKECSINIEIVKQSNSFSNYLIPDTIILTPQNCRKTMEGCMALEKLSKQMGICFDFSEKPCKQPKIIQWGLRSFSSTLNEYRDNLFRTGQTAETDYPYRRKVFNLDSLKFERSEECDVFDKELSLIQYNIQYEWLHRFWLQGQCFNIDRNWGQFLFLAEHKKNVVFYDEESRILATPSSMFLPKFITKSLILLSGEIPTIQRILIDGVSIWVQLYKNIPKTFADNLFKKLEQKVQSHKFGTL